MPSSTRPDPPQDPHPPEAPMQRRTIDVDERLPLAQTVPLSLQHLFAMFGATVLVP